MGVCKIELLKNIIKESISNKCKLLEDRKLKNLHKRMREELSTLNTLNSIITDIDSECFYTITNGDKYLNSSITKKDTGDICEAMRFREEDGAKRFSSTLTDDYKPVKVSFIISDI